MVTAEHHRGHGKLEEKMSKNLRERSRFSCTLRIMDVIKANHPAPVSAVVFDLGEVLATPVDLFERLARAAEVPADEMERAYWFFRDDHDRGGSAERFWTSVLAEVGAAAGPDRVSMLALLDATAWATIRPDALEVFRLLADSHVTVSILSNAPVELAVEARKQEWAGYVDGWFFSGELQLAKPDARIYEIVAESLGVEPSRILFFDDRQVNVEAATRAGWDARLWVSGAETKAALSGLNLI